MTKTYVSNIGRNFFEEIDNYLAKNWQNLRCAEIHDIYSQFFRDLKEFKGNSNGFTGLSEYLIFRFLYHLLGGSFERKQVTPDLWEFVSKSNNNLRIGQSVRVTIDNRKFYPDIVVYESNRLIAVVQIKVYLTNGLEEVGKVVETLESLRGSHSEMRALLVIFYGLSSKGRILPRLEKIKNDKQYKQWFDFLILKQNNKLLREVLQKCLGLERIRAASPNNG